MREPTGRYDMLTNELVLWGLDRPVFDQLAEAHRLGEVVRVRLAARGADPEYDVLGLVSATAARPGLRSATIKPVSGTVLGEVVG